jgi:hypothetical protein
MPEIHLRFLRRGVGCIFAEMTSSRPLFPAATNVEQLNCIWGVLGTPTVDSWPKLETYPEYKPATYHQCAPTDLAQHVPRYSPSLDHDFLSWCTIALMYRI